MPLEKNGQVRLKASLDSAVRSRAQPNPLIGLPWEQERCPGRGDVALQYNNCFTMELAVSDAIPEWGGQEVRLSMEEDVAFTRAGCRPIDGRQTEFYLI